MVHSEMLSKPILPLVLTVMLVGFLSAPTGAVEKRTVLRAYTADPTELNREEMRKRLPGHVREWTDRFEVQDPRFQGWSFDERGAVRVEWVQDPLPSWRIVQSGSQQLGNYLADGLTSSQRTAVHEHGVRSTITLRIREKPDKPSIVRSQFSVRAGGGASAARMDMHFDANDALDPVVWVVGARKNGQPVRHTVEGGAGEFHTYELIYRDARINKADLRIDGEIAVENMTLSTDANERIRFGGAAFGKADFVVRNVKIAILGKAPVAAPEPKPDHEQIVRERKRALEVASTSWRKRDDPRRRFLAVDRSLHEELKGLELEMGQAKHKGTVRSNREAAWERKAKLNIGYVLNVFRDHQGRYRMYYEVMRANAKRATAVAFSEDGVHWKKPALNLAPELLDHPNSNLIRVDTPDDLSGRGKRNGKWYRSGTVFYDRKAEDTQHRYKMLWRNGHDIYVASSEDGLRFNTRGRAVNHYADTAMSTFRDPVEGGFVIYGRHWFDRGGRPTRADRLGADGQLPVRRGIAMHRTEDWSRTPWPEESVQQLVLDPLDIFRDGGWTDVYVPGVVPYQGQYVGIPSVYHRQPLPDLSATGGPLYPMFMYSHDGRTWRFPDRTHPIVDLDPMMHKAGISAREDFGQLYLAPSLVQRNGDLYLYGWYRTGAHGKNVDQQFHELFSIRRDGFGRLSTDGKRTGTWRTPPIRIPSDAERMYVNANVTGALRVGARPIESDGRKPFLESSIGWSRPLRGDQTAVAIDWNGTVSELAGRLVHLNIEIADGDIYSFWFE